MTARGKTDPPGELPRRSLGGRILLCAASLLTTTCGDSPERHIATPLPLAVITAPTPQPAPPPAEPTVKLSVPGDGQAQVAGASARTTADFDARYPLHGLSFHVLAHVHARPERGAHVIGYMRRGARFRAAEGVRAGGCDTRWHELASGGFVCRGRGFLIGRQAPQFESTPAPPRLTDPLPYPYYKNVARDVPQFWRIPTAEEERTARELVATLRLEQEEAAAARATTQAGTENAAAPAPGVPESGPSAEAVAEAEGAPASGPGRDERLPDHVRMGMQRGFFISRDTRHHAPSSSGGSAAPQDVEDFVRTVRGAYVRGDALLPVQTSALHGHQLGGRLRLPLGMVYFGKTQAIRRDPVTGQVRPAEELARFAPASLAGRSERFGRFDYQLARDGRFIQTRAMRIARRVARPPLVPRGARWIHINLAEQVLVAYEGDTPVYATLVASGKEGYETPTGIFRIQAKHVSTTMDGSAGSDDAYSIEDVPWTMYFKGSFALHGAFWHDRFGRVRSHGCVNLAPRDAKLLFDWSTPSLPSGWHGVLVPPRKHSTYVLID